MRQTELRLSKKDDRTLEAFRAKGSHKARETNRAHILAALHRKVPESQIMAVLGVGRTAIWRTRAAYLQGGMALAPVPDRRENRAPRSATLFTDLGCGVWIVGGDPHTQPGNRGERLGLSDAKKGTVGKVTGRGASKNR